MKATYLLGLKKMDRNNYQKYVFCMHPGELSARRLYMAIVRHPLDVNSGLDLISLVANAEEAYYFYVV